MALDYGKQIAVKLELRYKNSFSKIDFKMALHKMAAILCQAQWVKYARVWRSGQPGTTRLLHSYVYIALSWWLGLSVLYDWDMTSNSPNSQIPECTCSISHNALSSEQKWAHFCSEWNIVECGTGAFWDLWNWSVHRPYSRHVTERMGCNVAIHPPPSIYPKAGNGALRDQWAIKYNCQNDSSTIAFTVRDLVHWNYVISQNIPRVCKSRKSLSIYVFAAYIFFVHPTLSPLK